MKRNMTFNITTFFMIIMLLIIVIMVTSVYTFSKSFYKAHLTHELENRLMLYSSLFKMGLEEEIVRESVQLHEKEAIHFVLFSESLVPLLTSPKIENKNIEHYQEWIKKKRGNQVAPILEQVETDMDFHIPHIWAMQKIEIEGKTTYLFMDQDTGEFQKTKIRLLILLVLMGGLSLIIGLLLSYYLSKRISKPLHLMGKITAQIADGNYDTKLPITSTDEVGVLAEDIRVMARKLKKYRDSRQELLSHISHDLRTPLTYIKAYAALMKDGATIEEKQRQEYNRIIYQESLRMEHLVKDLFELTKLDEGRIELNLENVSLVPWLSSILENRDFMFKQHKIATEFHFGKENIEVFIDKERMTQVINNLLENSIRYTEEGKITIQIKKEKEYAIIDIKDTGAGIPKEDLPHIWNRFYRVDKSRSTHSGGSGLGLSIVKKIVTMHKGIISVESELGKGTTFSIKLKSL